MEFRLVEIWDGWDIRSPDNIEFVFGHGEEEYSLSASILELSEIYISLKNEEPIDQFIGAGNHIEYRQVDEGKLVLDKDVQLSVEPVNFRRKYSDFLSSVFETLDQINTDEGPTDIGQHHVVKEVYKDVT